MRPCRVPVNTDKARTRAAEAGWLELFERLAGQVAERLTQA